MKKTIQKSLMGLTLICLLATGCSKSGSTGATGPAGPAGPAGPTGPTGIQGNANVAQYTYGAQNFATSSYTTLNVTTTQDTMDNSAWYVYLYYSAISRWYFIPGYGSGGSTMYRVSMSYISPSVSLYIDKVGAGENYSQARVVRVYANSSTVVTTGVTDPKQAPLDYSDYEQVRKRYGFQ